MVFNRLSVEKVVKSERLRTRNSVIYDRFYCVEIIFDCSESLLLWEFSGRKAF